MNGARGSRCAGEAIWLAACFPLLGFEVGLAAAANEALERPAVLAENGRVLQANAAARQAGIAAGMAQAAAQSLVAELACCQRDAQAERERLGLLGLAGYRYSSRVSLAWPTAKRPNRKRRADAAPLLPAAVLLEVKGSLRLFGDGRANATALTTVLRKVAACFRGLGHRAQLAAAATPLAALALARAGLDGLPEDATAALRQVPLACLDISAPQLERLANMGLRHLGQVLELPAAELGSRFQPPLVDYLHRLTGRKADPRPCIEPPERFRSTAQLLEAASDLDALLLPMRRLAVELAHWLTARRLGSAALIWKLQPLTGPATTLTVRFAAPTADAATFLALSRLRLEALSGGARGGALGEVATVGLRTGPVTAMPLSPAASLLLQPPTAAGDSDDAPRRSSNARIALVDLLTARLGGNAIHTLSIQDDHRPEHAWMQQQPAAKPSAAGQRSATPAPTPPAEREAGSRPLPGSRPLWLTPTPQPIPQQQAAAFDFLAGPERIETGWWDAAEQRLCRDYFVVAAPGQVRLWVFRNCRRDQGRSEGTPEHPQQWYLHGYFA